MTLDCDFGELMLFARFKEKPGLFLGTKSLMSLRDQLFGMNHAFAICGKPDYLRYFHGFTDWYHREVIKDQNGYACWWNHMLYTSGNSDWYAFDMFFREFEKYLDEVHGLQLPAAQWK